MILSSFSAAYILFCIYTIKDMMEHSTGSMN